MGEDMLKLTEALRDKLTPYLAVGRVVFVVGFSGGRDSLALLWGLHIFSKGELCGRFDILAAHFNHGLRGEAAMADEEFCRQFCEQYGIEYVAARSENLSAAMANLEQRARQARYAWFDSLLCKEKEAGREAYLMTAHHLEDQAETVLLHLLRGSGTAGLAAMREANGRHLRPLLNVSREVLQGALDEVGLSWCEDLTNADTEYTRNFVRMRVMPILREVNPQADRALVQTAEVAAAEEDYLASVIAEKMRVAQVGAHEVAYPWASFAAEGLAIRRRLVRAIWLSATGCAVCPLSFAQVESVLNLAAGQAVNLSGAVWAARRGKRLIMRTPTEEELRHRREKSRKGQ